MNKVKVFWMHMAIGFTGSIVLASIHNLIKVYGGDFLNNTLRDGYVVMGCFAFMYFCYLYWKLMNDEWDDYGK